jgi:hypothetical protein
MGSPQGVGRYAKPRLAIRALGVHRPRFRNPSVRLATAAEQDPAVTRHG